MDQVVNNKIYEFYYILLVILNTFIYFNEFSEKRDNPQSPISYSKGYNVFYTLYVFDLFMKIYGKRIFAIDKKGYNLIYWNILDALFAFLWFINNVIPNILSIDLLKIIRILRLFQILTIIDGLEIIMKAFFQSLTQVFSATFLILIFILFSGSIMLNLTAGVLKNICIQAETGIPLISIVNCGYIKCPNSTVCVKYYQNTRFFNNNSDNFLYAIYQILKLITLDGWTEASTGYLITLSPYYIILLLVFIIIGSYFLMPILLIIIRIYFGEAHERITNKSSNIRFQNTYNLWELKIKSLWSKTSLLKMNKSFIIGKFNPKLFSFKPSKIKEQFEKMNCLSNNRDFLRYSQPEIPSISNISQENIEIPQDFNQIGKSVIPNIYLSHKKRSSISLTNFPQTPPNRRKNLIIMNATKKSMLDSKICLNDSLGGVPFITTNMESIKIGYMKIKVENLNYIPISKDDVLLQNQARDKKKYLKLLSQNQHRNYNKENGNIYKFETLENNIESEEFSEYIKNSTKNDFEISPLSENRRSSIGISVREFAAGSSRYFKFRRFY